MVEQSITCGSFDLHEPVGSGGMGEVWRATHRRTGRAAAVKILDPELSRHDDYIEWFHQEIRAHARLEHPNIVRLYDLGIVGPEAVEQSDGAFAEESPYFAMEYVEGGTLRSGVVVGAWKTVERILHQILSGLAFAHARDVVHRDLKPSNILCDVGPEFRVKISDFGLAFEVLSGGEQRSATARLRGGTPDYMAPEQLRGEWRRYGPWTDLYAVGCMTFELVCGRRPFPGNNPQEIATGHLVDAVPEPEPMFPVPEGLGGFLERLLQKEPERRFWAAADAARELSRISEGFSEPEDREESSEGPHPTEVSADRGEDQSGAIHSELDIEPTPLEMKPAVTATVPTPPSGIRRETSGAGGWLEETGRRAADPTPALEDPHPGTRPEVPETWRRNWETRTGRPGMPLGLFGLREIPFIGRESERDQLWELLREVVEQGETRSVLVSGELGVGSSRLVEWSARRGMECGVCTFLRVTHTPYGGPGDGVTGLLQEIFNTWEMTRGEVRRQVERTLKSWVGEPVDEQDLELDVRALTELLRPVGTQNRRWETSYEFSDLVERMAVVGRVLRQLCERRPVFLWFDDIHWSDASREFARYLSEQSPTQSLLVAMTVSEGSGDGAAAREAIARIGEREEVRHVELEPLDRRGRRSLIERLVPLEADLAETVVEKTAGRPMFSVALLRDWVDADLLSYGDGRYHLDADVADAFPDDLDALWRRRLERIVEQVPEERREQARRSLEVATVLGTHVDASEWRTACRRAGVEPHDEVVERMLDLGLASPEPTGWRFVHEHFVQCLVDRAREGGRYERYAVACAEAIEHCYPGRNRETAGRRAEFFRAGGALELAAEVYRMSIAYASDIKNHEHAKRLLERHEEVLDELGADDDHRARLKQKGHRASIATDEGDHAEAERLVAEVLEVASREGWASMEADSLIRHSILLHRSGEHRRALAALDRAEETYRALGEIRGVARVELQRAIIETWTGHHDEAIEQAESAESRFDSVGSTVASCAAQQWKTYALIYRGDYDRAEQAAKVLLERAREIGHRGTERECLNQLGEIARYREEWERAREWYSYYRNMNEKLGLFDAMVGTLNLAMVDLGEGEVEAAADRFDALLDGARERGAHHLIPTIQLGRLAVAAERRDWSSWDDRLSDVREALSAVETREPDQRWLLGRVIESLRDGGRADALEDVEAIREELQRE